MSYQIKQFLLEIKELSEDGTFEGYAAVFNNVDRGGDVIEKGAFRRTIDHKGGALPVLWQHDTATPIGVGVEMREDERGLWVKAKLALTTAKGREAYDLLKMGAIKGLSIGYRVIKDAVENGKRLLKEIELFEYSVVTIPMNPLAEVAAVKAGRMLSAKTRASIMTAVEHLQALLDSDAASQSSGDPADSGKSHSADDRNTKDGDPDELHSLKRAIDDLTVSMRAA